VDVEVHMGTPRQGIQLIGREGMSVSKGLGVETARFPSAGKKEEICASIISQGREGGVG
jgi:hypothetical protein